MNTKVKVLDEIEQVDALEKQAWEVFRNDNAKVDAQAEAILTIQWCINRRTAAFNSLNQFAQFENQNRAVSRQVLAPGPFGS